MRKCSKCSSLKELVEFVSARDPSKFVGECLSCRAKKKIRSKKYYADNKDKLNLQKSVLYNEKKADILSQRKVYYEKNKDFIKKKVGAYRNLRRQQDSIFRLRENISVVIAHALKMNNGSKYGNSILNYLPYSIQELEEHLEKQFEPWMTWQNWGKYDAVSWDDNDPLTWTWNIDHIIPQSSFLYTSMKEENFQRCWALSNLRPYSAKLNLLKGAR